VDRGFVEGHQIKHWADGGNTSLDNLVLLCRHHHHLVHEGGFACEKSANGEIHFKDQRQQALLPWSVLPGVSVGHDVQHWMDHEFFEAKIDSETCMPNWYSGERKNLADGGVGVIVSAVTLGRRSLLLALI